MLKQLKDAVIALGSQVVSKAKSLYRGLIQTFYPKVVTGEYIGKGELTNQSRRAFFGKSALFTALVICFVILPTVSHAAVPAAVTTAITDAVADVGTIGAAILGVIVVIASFAWMRRPIR